MNLNITLKWNIVIETDQEADLIKSGWTISERTVLIWDNSI